MAITIKRSIPAALMAAVLFSGCASSVTMPQSQAEFQLFVDVTPKEAVIIVDDEVVGNGQHTADVPLRLTAGTRRVAIVCDGYHTFMTTLEYIQPGETYTLKTRLIASEF
ncbi:MAG: PEGA domain-containing protein [Proteobacteria bacterium]|nr:PEGA domain-containing protein [Pseudomonadota bacterium]